MHISFPNPIPPNVDADLLTNFHIFQDIHGLHVCPWIPMGARH